MVTDVVFDGYMLLDDRKYYINNIAFTVDYKQGISYASRQVRDKLLSGLNDYIFKLKNEVDESLISDINNILMDYIYDYNFDEFIISSGDYEVIYDRDHIIQGVNIHCFIKAKML